MFDESQTAAHAQALWRFLANDAVTPEGLTAPLLAHAHEVVRDACDGYALSIHDGSRINYRTHHGKRDRKQLTHKTDVGYELQSSLLVSDRDGAPLVAPAQNWVTAEGVWQSRQAALATEEAAHLDELTERMAWLEKQGFGRRCKAVAESLEFQRAREVVCDGKTAEQWIAGTDVVITRSARPKQKGADGRRHRWRSAWW